MTPHERIGDYEVLSEIGRGGMGRVYRVRNVISDRLEAMKVLRPELVEEEDLAARFKREIKVLAALEHPHIASLRTALSSGGQFVMIMELVEGESLAQRVRRGPIPVEEAVRYIDHVLDALSYAHARGVIHRDIKPANMLLTAEGVVKLTDFGIARSLNEHTMTATGVTTGSLAYMSPEQVNGARTDARSDLYSVGISLYELVTGQKPFETTGNFAVLVAHLQQMPRPPIELQPSMSEGLNAAIMKAVAKDPGDRFQSAAELRDALRGSLDPAGAVREPPLRSWGPASAGSSREPLVGGALAGEAAPPQLSGVPSPPVSWGPPSDRPQESEQTMVRDVQTARPVTAGVRPLAPFASEHVSDATASTAGGASVASAPVPTAPLPVSDASRGGREGAAAIPARSRSPVVMLVAIVAVVAVLAGVALYIQGSETSAGQPPSGATSAAPDPIVQPPIDTDSSTSSGAGSTAPEDLSGGAGGPPSEPPPFAPPSSGAPPSASAPLPAPSASGSATPEQSPAASRQTSAPGASSGAGSAAPTPVAPRSTTPPAAAAGAAQPQQPAADAVDLDRLEIEIDRLSARAAAVDQALNVLQQEQARQGLGLRTDMVTRQVSMNTNLARAQEAAARGDGARAQRFRDLAAADVAALEKFLGR